MKKFFLLLSLSFSTLAFAGNDTIIFPQVYNFGSNVQVQVWNHTDRSVSCSGTIYMNTESGQRDTDYYFDYISPRMTSFRTFYSRRLNDRITSVSHSIFCH